MTSCEDHIRGLIQEKTFITIAEFMMIALYHPEFGYYMTRQPLGADADFMTAPEASAMFGEIVCFWAIEQYHRLHRPQKIALVELGPGRGALMTDFLRTARLLPDFFNALDIHLVEISPKMQEIQRDVISCPEICWHSDVEEAMQAIKGLPALMIANEFFDALPVRQFQKTLEGWAERGVVLSQDDRLTFECKGIDENDIPFPPARPNDIFEYRPAAQRILENMIRHLSRDSGAALIVDYGYLDGYGDTLQAVSRQRCVPVLQNPGVVDITAHVDFKALQNIAGEKSTLTTQAEFLIRHGIVKLVQAHTRKASEAQKDQLALEFHKLISSQEMGILFKVLEIEKRHHD